MPPAELAAIDRTVNARPYAAMADGGGWWKLPLEAVNCGGYAAWKWAELRLEGRPATIVAWYLRDRRQWHAAVRSGAWLLDSLGPSPRPWRPIPGGWIEYDLAFKATKTRVHWVAPPQEAGR